MTMSAVTTTKIRRSRRNLQMYENQLHKPKLKYDEKQIVKMYLKAGSSTMLLCKDLTLLAANSLSHQIEKFCKEHNTKLEGNFIFTR